MPGSIQPQSIVGTIMKSRPATVAVFMRNRMHCPGCVMSEFMTIAESAESHGVDAAALLAELRDALRADTREGAR